MTPLDWWVLAGYFAVLLGVGLLPTRKASGSTEDFFVSGRRLPWWVAGTSLIAASFASDTPLLVSGLVRSRGLWGNWLWWGFGISAVLTVFLFAPLWKRAAVITDAELTELRYSGNEAAVLRGAKAIYWGLLFNCFTTGAWGVVGLVKVTEALTGMGRSEAILLCAAIGMVYAILAGLWGLVLTDMFQFAVAVVGGLVVAFYALDAAGGLGAVLDAAGPGRLSLVPTSEDPLKWCLPFLLVQWWAWKNTDGSGVMVQRWASCRTEGHALGATLWYTIVHYGLRVWPWALVGLASLVLVKDAALPRAMPGKDAPDHEAAYAVVLRDVLPRGIRGAIVAWFFAEFMGAVAQAMSWGGSLLVNDLYRRFLRKEAAPGHYVWVARLASVLVMAGAVGTAYLSSDIAAAFKYVILGTAAIGVVNALRWLWWRMNAWSEAAAMVLSPALTFVVAKLKADGVAFTPMAESLTIVFGASIPSVALSLLTGPCDPARLEAFYRRVRPPSFGWGPIARACPDVRPAISLSRAAVQWLLGLALVYGTLWGVGGLILGRSAWAWGGLAGAATGGVWLLLTVSRGEPESSAPGS